MRDVTGADEEKEEDESPVCHVSILSQWIIEKLVRLTRVARSCACSVGCSLVGWACVRHAAQSICSTACLASACPSVCLFASWLSPASPYCLHLSRAFSAAVIHMSSWPAAQDRLLRRGCIHLNPGTVWHKYKRHASLTSRWCTLIFTDTCSNMHGGSCWTTAGKHTKTASCCIGKKKTS